MWACAQTECRWEMLACFPSVRFSSVGTHIVSICPVTLIHYMIYVTMGNFNIHWPLNTRLLRHHEEGGRVTGFNARGKLPLLNILKCSIKLHNYYSPKKYLRIILIKFNFCLTCQFLKPITPQIQLHCAPSIWQVCRTYLLLNTSVTCMCPYWRITIG